MTTTGTPTQSPHPLYSVAGFFRLTVDQYREMIRNNTLTPDDRVELLDGYLVNKMPRNPPHRSSVLRLSTRLRSRLPSGWLLMSQMPVDLGTSMPEPDGAIVRGDDATYDSRDPGPADIGIVVEVSDSSLPLDRGPKAEFYARAAVRQYWIVNIQDRRVEVYNNPDPAADPPAYAARTDYGIADAVPIVLDGVTAGTIPVADLIP